MKILKRHIGLSVIIATGFVLLGLSALQIFVTFVGQLSDMGVGNYGLFATIKYALLTLPSDLYGFFPMAGLLGAILGLGHLAAHNELTVMRASGVSIRQIVWAVLRAAILLIIVMTIIGEGLSPRGMYLARREKIIAKSGGQAFETKQGLWLKDGNNFIYIQKVLHNSHLQGINQYQFNDSHQLVIASHAQSAAFKDGQWWLENVSETHFNKNSTKNEKIKRKSWGVTINPSLLNVSKIDSIEISLINLVKLIQYKEVSGLNAHADKLAFWQRVMQPLSTLIMIFLAVPFIFGTLRSISMGVRIVTGVIVGAAFYALNQFFGPLTLVYQIPPIFSAIFPSFVFLVVGFLLMRRVR